MTIPPCCMHGLPWVVSTGQRSKEYTRLFSSSALASGFGPALAIGVFLATGNSWTEHALQVCWFFSFDGMPVGSPSAVADASDMRCAPARRTPGGL